MRALLLTGVTAGAILFGVVQASAADGGIKPLSYVNYGWDISSVTSLYVGGTSFDDDLCSGCSVPSIIGGGGSVNINGMGYGIQLDALGEAGQELDNEYAFATAVIGGHVYLRDPNRGLVGVVANIAGYGDAYNEYGYVRHALGIEGQVYFGQALLYGQVAILGKTTDSCGCASTSTYAKAEGQFFINPNAMIAGRVEAQHGVIYDDTPFTRTTLGLRGELKLGTGNPFSLFADAAFSDNSSDGTHQWNDTVLKAGINVDVGKMTLFDRAHSGVSLTQPFAGIGELFHLYND